MKQQPGHFLSIVCLSFCLTILALCVVTGLKERADKERLGLLRLNIWYLLRIETIPNIHRHKLQNA